MPLNADDSWLARVAALCGASDARAGELVQALWSGYGEIRRVHLEGQHTPATVVVKRVQPPATGEHPRGWSSPLSHRRKMRSYEVEWAFYAARSARCSVGCRVPRWLGGNDDTHDRLFVLEDLSNAGFTRTRRDRDRGPLAPEAVALCLRWLASFHATFLHEAPHELWPTGTYWHLATRPDELAAMNDEALRDAAAALDSRLNGARYQTWVHGDAKLANFCFAGDDTDVAAVDFQYVGGGVGVKDVAYFLGSALDPDALEADAARWLDAYFTDLHRELRGTEHDAAAIEREWRELFSVAWADFERFLDGWAPDHWKRNSYGARQVQAALKTL